MLFTRYYYFLVSSVFYILKNIDKSGEDMDMEQDKKNILAHKLKEIERLRTDLIKLVVDKGGNFQDREVIRLGGYPLK
ncbi:Spo0E family sporulation regulatory protein-aspartic acid phosphatase [Thermanaerosceptrum fracticalcis]|uniref:Spo0E family sporulation regulatory protein-aspartic acid phosphatase n=1 Tax=Thermanaerosceptrum fracticalcis TaxID=1712410 RepID=A0A7G6E7V2_THEFR|nr:Spo0E family sporulation regulatory protein-aspartic acid phosphatase [Thermanaerosceptrum fracticalcis]